MAWTLSFSEIRRVDLSRVGGKAANLGELTGAGLPVPPGFCVTADAYRQFVRHAAAAQRIEQRLYGLDPENSAQLEDAAAGIRELLEDRAVPDEIATSVVDAYRRLERLLGSAGGPGRLAVAVRSSATAEDLPDASFAGQQDTYLNVRGEDQLLDHVRRCWASLWTARAIAYRVKQGYEHDQVALAVAVQAMVQADVAGVMFTADPVTSDRDSVVIDASFGLGEAIVSGIVTPDTWTVAKRDGEIKSRRIGHKERQVLRSEDGGTHEVEVPPERRDEPSLRDEQVAALAEIGRRIEDHYAQPMDIEWAFAGGRPFVLQARPITTLAQRSPELTDAAAAAEPGEFNRTMFVEIFPDALSPAFLSVVEPLFTGMLDFTFRKLGFRPPAGIRGVASFYSQPYFNQRYIEAALAPLRPQTRAAFVARIVNPFGHESGSPLELSWPFLRMSWRLLRLMRSLHTVLPHEVERYQASIADLQRLNMGEVSEEELVDHVVRLVFRTANRLLDYDFLLIALVGVTYQALGRLLEPYFGDQTPELRARLISGVTGNVTMETNKRLWDLAVIARGSAEVAEVLRHAGSVDELREKLLGKPEGERFTVELDRFLAEYGHREVRMDILYPTWVEDPAPVLAFVRGYLDADEASSPHRQQERLVREREEIARDVKERLRRSLRGRLFVWPIFNWVLRHTQANTRHRDTMHFELTRLFPPFRRLLLELGRRWASRGVIGQPDDVFFLTLAEMQQAAGSSESLAERVRLRRQKLDSDLRTNPPPIIRDGVEVWSISGQQTSEEDSAAGIMRGVAGSPGRVSGAVRIVRGPDEFHKLAAREILVAPLTNPVWTPLFAVAGGLITDVGGILSHGAIVAREYGIPAVMAVSGATTSLSDGQLVTVDGSRGVVEIDEHSPAAEEAAS